jgi:hypothetical protein
VCRELSRSAGRGAMSRGRCERCPELSSVAVGLGEIDSPDPAAEKIVSALVSLAHAMNLDVTAEDIETPAQLQRLRALGCDTAQGWLLARPGPAHPSWRNSCGVG